MRIAMTVGERRIDSDGTAYLGHVTEEGHGADRVRVALLKVVSIGASLSSWAQALEANKLISNSGICHQGVVPAGDGFKMTLEEVRALGYHPDRLPRVLRKYIIGRDLVQKPEVRFIIDFFGRSGEQAQAKSRSFFSG